MTPLGSVIIAAHNEEQTIGRLLSRLVDAAAPQPWQIIVMCNGCTDRTADVARSFGVDVHELGRPSKNEAQRQGDAVASAFPRLYIDADVEIGAQDLALLTEALHQGPYLAAAPARRFPWTGASWLVRAYYDVWQALPQVQAGLFGRGVVALSAAGHHRVRTAPRVMADDLVMAEYFAPHERVVVDDATVVIHPPRHVMDLVRRRARVLTGNVQADAEQIRTEASRTTVSRLVNVVRRRPALVGKLPVFLAVTAAAAARARRAISAADYDTWERDNSSRTA